MVDSGEIRVEAGPGTTVVRLVGEIDVALREQASLSMATALTGVDPIVVDSTDARFVDSSGIAFVMQMKRAADEAGLDLSLRDPHRVLRDVLEIIGASGLLRDADEEPAPVG
ncbi:STAS domain-containing protein [Cellulomonas sp. DKR-3]|uniref:STAS domain-containing protein n=1 Tax=Cellulomonas fulva TaxID=2835530 RepID=A0ABS5U2L8_9CELL|nr:STAS domain-containing protein [Cellulomonas fulva]MBT0995561.1 STAS domain-containing protein [Cellulomonas fulva]